MDEEQRAALRADNRRSSGVAVTRPRPVGPVGSALGFTRPAAPTPGSYSGPGSVTREAFTVTPPPTRQTQPNIPAPVPVVPRGRPEPLDFRDSSYNSQIAAIERALRDFETGSATRGQRYQEDFTTGLGRLGFRPAQPAMAMSGADGAEGGVGFATGPVQGSFDIEGEMDRTSAAARGTRGMRDEFAGRGTLRSSDFANSFSDFQNRLQQQLTGMETGRTRFGEDLSTELAQFQARTQEQRQSAQEAAQNRALMRQLSQMGF